MRGLLTSLVMLLMFGAVGVVLWFGGQEVLLGRMTGGELSAFVFFAVIVAGSVGALSEVAIARALLRNPAILLLDEATSALDGESEKSVQLALQKLMAGRTTLVIAHRLATVRRASRIIVIKAGRIEAMGQHDELVAQGGLYARLAALQFRDAKEISTASASWD